MKINAKIEGDIRIGQTVEFTGIYNHKLQDAKLCGVVTGFHESGRIFVLTKSGFKWMLPQHYLEPVESKRYKGKNK